MSKKNYLDNERNLALELVRVTEASAIAAAKWVGLGDKNSADGAAVTAMRSFLSTVQMRGIVVIGEGEKDAAPMLYNGENLGNGSGPLCDIAVDPIDGTRLTALGMNNAISVLAIAEKDSMYDVSTAFYMKKLVTGPEAAGKIDINLPVAENLNIIAKAKGIDISQVTAAVLDRPRHKDLIHKIRIAGSRVKLISDGDIAAAIAAVTPNSGIDVLFGIGGTPEGVLAACAIKILGGDIQGELFFLNEIEKNNAIESGHKTDTVLNVDTLVATDNCYFVATGITDGDLLSGVRYSKNIVHTQSIIMRSETGTIRKIFGEHRM